MSSSFEIGRKANVLHPSTKLHAQITEDQIVRTLDRMNRILTNISRQITMYY